LSKNAIGSLEALRANPDWAKLPLFDRKGWKRVRFGDVVENLNETERDPVGAGIERFIAMEHLEPGSLHIREWGNVADGTTFNRRCRPGQVLFGKRRAYQRKVAVAEFDAVVSGDIYVFAPKDDLVRRRVPDQSHLRARRAGDVRAQRFFLRHRGQGLSLRFDQNAHRNVGTMAGR
jgi:hypothetical protein